MCVNETQLQSKVKSLEKRDIFLGIFSLLHVFPLANVSIFHFCSIKRSRCFLKNLSLVQVSVTPAHLQNQEPWMVKRVETIAKDPGVLEGLRNG